VIHKVLTSRISDSQGGDKALCAYIADSSGGQQPATQLVCMHIVRQKLRQEGSCGQCQHSGGGITAL